VTLGAVQRGAQDFLLKSQRTGELLSRAIRYAIERKWSEEWINHLAHYDDLTNLPNRRLLRDRLQREIAQARRHKQFLGVMLLDLDNFKSINDTLGHAAGDLLLMEVSRRLMACLRGSDTVARLGGDEFTLMLPNIARPEDLSVVATKIAEALIPPVVIGGQELFVTASMGSCICPGDGDSVDQLLKNADSAMYRSKQSGGNSHQFFSTELHARAAERFAQNNALRRALERQEFVLHYQPKLDLRTGGVVGVEALVRWRHPEWGMVPPAKFIPLAEENGMIIPLGEWVLRAAAQQCRAWQNAGLAVPSVAVNLSHRQLHEKGLLEIVTRALCDTGLDPRQLELELTESGIMNYDHAAMDTLRSLHDMGVEISIDDFGAGWSSLKHLKHFPVSTLKIDQYFVRGISDNSDDGAIVAAIIAMAHSLRLKVVAEGVEQADQMEFLRHKACDQVQGYFIGRPAAAEDIPRLIGTLGSQMRMGAS
jgi:diguanylate cyclase (GGDEF)-like protein